MGLCDVLFHLHPDRFYGCQIWSRKRLGSRAKETPSDVLTLYIFSLRLVPEHDLHRRFDDMVRDLRRTYPFRSFRAWGTSY